MRITASGENCNSPFVGPYEWVSHRPDPALYELLFLVNNVDGYGILIPESIIEVHPDLKWVLTDESQGGLFDSQPLGTPSLIPANYPLTVNQETAFEKTIKS